MQKGFKNILGRNRKSHYRLRILPEKVKETYNQMRDYFHGCKYLGSRGSQGEKYGEDEYYEVADPYFIGILNSRSGAAVFPATKIEIPKEKRKQEVQKFFLERDY